MEHTAREAAAAVLARGWQPVRIRLGDKQPVDRSWTTKTYTTAELAAFDDHNIGIRLDAPLVDIDLDCEEAVAFGGLLPATDMKHGRAGATFHYWYLVDDERSVKTVLSDPRRDDDKAVIAEWRTGRHQTVIPPSSHPNGSRLEWRGPNQLWGDPANVTFDALSTRLKWVAASALIARYWPEQGVRHTADLAWCGALSLIPDYDLHEYVPRILSGAARIAGDEEYETRGYAAWKTTMARKAAGAQLLSWGTLITECGIPKEVVDQIEEWLTPPVPLEDLPEPDLPFNYKQSTEDIRHMVMSRKVPKAEILLPGLLYKGNVTWLVGKPGDGKTMMALYMIREVLRKGKTVALFDEESGLKRIARRLIPLGVTEEEMTRFYYYEMPSARFAETSHCRLLEKQITEEIKADLVVFDSTADIISNSGYDENSNVDITNLYNALMLPIKSAGCSVMALDHQAKIAHDSPGGSYAAASARGAGAKGGKGDLQWNFKGTIIKGKKSAISLIRIKDRDGDMPESVHFVVTGDDDEIIIERVSHAGRPSGPHVEQIIGILRKDARGEENAMFRQQIVDQLSGDTNQIQDALRWLQTEEAEKELNIFFYKQRNKHYYYYEPAIELDFSSLPDEEDEDEAA